MKIFLIAGKSGSGKSEVAKMIKEYSIYKLQTCAITQYSKFIKLFAEELTDWDGNPNTKPRAYLQQMGDKIRIIDNDYFTRRMIEDIKIYETLCNTLVVSDVRYPDEIEEIKLNYDEVYSIYVENQFANSNLSIEEQMHKTETALENYEEFDYIIVNDNLENVKTKVFKILDELNK